MILASRTTHSISGHGCSAEVTGNIWQKTHETTELHTTHLSNAVCPPPSPPPFDSSLLTVVGGLQGISPFTVPSLWGVLKHLLVHSRLECDPVPEWVLTTLKKFGEDPELLVQMEEQASAHGAVVPEEIVGNTDDRVQICGAKVEPHKSPATPTKVMKNTGFVAILGVIIFFCREETKEWFRKRVVLANIPSFRFFAPGEHANVPSFHVLFRGSIRMYPRSSFVPGERPPKSPFWKTALFHRVLQEAAQRGAQFYFIVAVLRTLFHAAKKTFSTSKIASP